jgi:hypothetical protein
VHIKQVINVYVNYIKKKSLMLIEIYDNDNIDNDSDTWQSGCRTVSGYQAHSLLRHMESHCHRNLACHLDF